MSSAVRAYLVAGVTAPSSRTFVREHQGHAYAHGVPRPDLETLQVAADRGMLAAHWAAVRGDDRAIISDAGNRTFSETNSHANELVRALRARGVQAGDGVA